MPLIKEVEQTQIKPKPSFVIDAGSLCIENDYLFRSYFEDEMEKLGYASEKKRDGEESKSDDSYSFSGKEIETFKKKSSLIELTSHLSFWSHEESYSLPSVSILSINSNKESLKDISTVILGYSSKIRDKYEGQLKILQGNLQKVNSIIEECEKVSKGKDNAQSS